MITLGILQLQSRYDNQTLRFAMLIKTITNRLYTTLIVENNFQLSINSFEENTKNIKKSDQEYIGSAIERYFGEPHQRPWQFESYLTI